MQGEPREVRGLAVSGASAGDRQRNLNVGIVSAAGHCPLSVGGLIALDGFESFKQEQKQDGRRPAGGATMTQ